MIEHTMTCGKKFLVDEDIYNSIKHSGWSVDNYGYPYLQTTKNGKKKNKRLHHFVLAAEEQLI